MSNVIERLEQIDAFNREVMSHLETMGTRHVVHHIALQAVIAALHQRGIATAEEIAGVMERTAQKPEFLSAGSVFQDEIAASVDTIRRLHAQLEADSGDPD